MAKLGNGNAMSTSVDIGVCLDSELSFCAPIENGNGDDGYCPRDFACPSAGQKNRKVHVWLAGQLLSALMGRISQIQ